MTAELAPFPIAVPDSALDDLRRRLDNARWPAELADSGWDYGTEQAFLRTVVERWRAGYDWRATESELNEWGSYVTTAAGQRVHLLHARSDGADAIPLVLVHGWPGSIVEFLDALPALRERFHTWSWFRCRATDSRARRRSGASTSRRSPRPSPT
jgi:microsomal epoxide hydrolase